MWGHTVFYKPLVRPLLSGSSHRVPGLIEEALAHVGRAFNYLSLRPIHSVLDGLLRLYVGGGRQLSVNEGSSPSVRRGSWSSRSWELGKQRHNLLWFDRVLRSVVLKLWVAKLSAMGRKYLH